ncbi:MAG: superoxide dismutase [Fe] [Bacteroidales bacterium]|nr:superoxide dismutase [Fe] [Bacteroidales bacterium]
MSFELPALPYASDALEPFISKETIDYHYGKHHNAYLTNLNKLIVGTEFEHASLDEIVSKSDGGIYNNGAQVWNHSFYWKCLSPKGGGQAGGKLLEAIVRDFGSFDAFKEQFTTAAATLFGAGWVWLSKDSSGLLHITKESNAGNPLKHALTPLLTIDVWEHAYYIDKRNLRPAYIEDFWKLVNWETPEGLYV